MEELKKGRQLEKAMVYGLSVYYQLKKASIFMVTLYFELNKCDVRKLKHNVDLHKAMNFLVAALKQ